VNRIQQAVLDFFTPVDQLFPYEKDLFIISPVPAGACLRRLKCD